MWTFPPRRRVEAFHSASPKSVPGAIVLCAVRVHPGSERAAFGRRFLDGDGFLLFSGVHSFELRFGNDFFILCIFYDVSPPFLLWFSAILCLYAPLAFEFI